MTVFGRRVTPRRYAHCFECGTETVQWLTHISPSSPGSYRGVRLMKSYTCSVCGEVGI